MAHTEDTRNKMINPAPLAQNYFVEEQSTMSKLSVVVMQNVIGKTNSKFAKGAG